MQIIKDAVVYIIPSIILCSIYYYKLKNISTSNLKSEKILNIIILLSFVVYLSILFSYTVSPVYGFSTIINWNNNLNLNPFRLRSMIIDKPFSFLKYILIFIPMGFLLPIICYNFRRLYKCIFIGFLLSIFIEVFQLLL